MKIGFVGDSTQGMGLGHAPIDAIESDELTFVWLDNPSGNNRIYYKTEWNGMYPHHR